MPTYANGPTPALPIAGGGISLVSANPLEMVLRQQVAPATYTGTATITAAELATRILSYTGAGHTLTLPTATQLDTYMPNAQQNDSLDFTVIATTGTATIAVGTGITSVGALTTAASTATMFRLRKTNAPGATSAWVIYRAG
jgi:hypothetical protein